LIGGPESGRQVSGEGGKAGTPVDAIRLSRSRLVLPRSTCIALRVGTEDSRRCLRKSDVMFGTALSDVGPKGIIACHSMATVVIAGPGAAEPHGHSIFLRTIVVSGINSRRWIERDRLLQEFVVSLAPDNKSSHSEDDNKANEADEGENHSRENFVLKEGFGRRDRAGGGGRIQDSRDCVHLATGRCFINRRRGRWGGGRTRGAGAALN